MPLDGDDSGGGGGWEGGTRAGGAVDSGTHSPLTRCQSDRLFPRGGAAADASRSPYESSLCSSSREGGRAFLNHLLNPQ